LAQIVVEVTGIRVQCGMCCQFLVLWDQPSAQLQECAGLWARPHRRPFVAAFRVSVNGVDQGWSAQR